jgi:MtaA/CmuA family methyltransferase
MTAEMTPRERFLAVARREEPDRVPACPWLTSAFYSSYYGVDPGAYYEDRELQLRAMLEFYGERFPDMQYFPGFRGSSGSTIEASALGCEIVILPGQTPHANPVVDDLRRDVPKLKVPDPERDGRMPMVLEHFAWLADRLPKYGFEVTAGFLHAPFDVALLVRGATDLMTEILLDPAGVHAMMDVITETCIRYVNKQYEVVGGTMVQIMFSDDSGARLSPQHWWEFSGQYIKRLVEGMPQDVVKLAHNCDQVAHIIDRYPDTGIDGLHFAPDIDVAEAKRRVGDRLCLIGNMAQLDTLLKGTPEEVEAECREMIRKGAPGGGYILSASGCLSGGTPLENIEAMVNAAARYGRYPIGG